MKTKQKVLYIRNDRGEYVGGLHIARYCALIAFIAFIVLGTLYSMVFAPIANSGAYKASDGLSFKEGALSERFECGESNDGFVCNDLIKLSEHIDGEEGRFIGKRKRVTAYSRKDSCHNPRGNECLTAIGRDTKEGVTVACPRSLKLGTPVWIEGIGHRVCEDRTAKWVERELGETFDIFFEDYETAKDFGRKMLTVTVL